MAGGAEWRWCKECHRTYRAGEDKVVLGTHYCPYPRCNARAPEDSLPWSQVLSANADYPEEPLAGEIYERGAIAGSVSGTGRNRLAVAAGIVTVVSILGWLIFMFMRVLFISADMNLSSLRTLVTIAFVLIVVSFVSGAAAVAFGIFALDKRTVRYGVEAGKWLATTGIVVGGLSALLALVLFMTNVMPLVFYLQKQVSS